ncbi:MAG: hypothetical protein AAGG48_02755 [Planctomycetota bacterium]
MALRTLAATVLFAMVIGLDVSHSVADELIKPSPAARLARGLNPTNWQMPKWKLPDVRSLLPNNDEKARIKKKKDGFFDEVGKTASNSWNKTKAAFQPENLSPMRMFPASARTPSQTTESKRGFWKSLLSPWPEEPEPSSDINQWFNQPRPQ